MAAAAPIALLSADGRSLTVRVPLAVGRRRGRKVVIAPAGGTKTSAGIPSGADTRATPDSPRHPDSALLKALARAVRWRKLLETGAYATVQDLAAAEKLNPSYVGRVLRLTLLSPAIVEAILVGQEGPEITLDRLLRPFPVEWEKQDSQKSAPCSPVAIVLPRAARAPTRTDGALAQTAAVGREARTSIAAAVRLGTWSLA